MLTEKVLGVTALQALTQLAISKLAKVPVVSMVPSTTGVKLKKDLGTTAVPLQSQSLGQDTLMQMVSFVWVSNTE